MSEHTPGPWHVGGTYMPNTPEARNNIWGPTPHGFQSGEVIAKHVRPCDARLIAAAPDLAQKLITLTETIGELDLATLPESVSVAFDAACAALTRAGL